jgi:hypothetical protein
MLRSSAKSLHRTTCSSTFLSERLFRSLSDEIRETVFEVLAMLIRGMFCKTAVQNISTVPASRCCGLSRETYAGARVVFRKVDLQMLHWMSLACSLTFSCDLATPFSSLSLRARFEAAFAPCLWSVSLVLLRSDGRQG